MLTVEQARKLKDHMDYRDACLKGSAGYRAANEMLAAYIESITLTPEALAVRLSPVVGVIRSMEMTHDEAVQRIINVL